MFRKIFSVVILTAVTNAFAMGPVYQSHKLAEDLSKNFDEMNYALNVEWDQKDSKFFDATVANFEKEIENLQVQGLTNKELIDYTLNNIKDKKIQKDIIEISNIVNESNMTGEEAREFVLTKINQTYSQGASWSGSRLGLKVAFFIGALLIIICVTKDRDGKHREPKREDPRECDEWSTAGFREGGYDNCEYYPYPQAL